MDNANTSSYRAGPHPRPLALRNGRGAPPGCLWGWRGEGQLLAAPHHQVAPDPAALFLIAPPPRDQRVERLLDRRPIAAHARVVQRRLDAIERLGPHPQPVGDLVDFGG